MHAKEGRAKNACTTLEDTPLNNESSPVLSLTFFFYLSAYSYSDTDTLTRRFHWGVKPFCLSFDNFEGNSVKTKRIKRLLLFTSERARESGCSCTEFACRHVSFLSTSNV